MSKKIIDQKLFIRTATLEDVPYICTLSEKVYGAKYGYSKKMVRSQIINFPEGQFVAVYDDTIVGHAATFITDEKTATTPHTWRHALRYGSKR